VSLSVNLVKERYPSLAVIQVMLSHSNCLYQKLKLT